MEKIPKTELYQRGIPLLAFLPILALLSGGTAAGAESSDEWELASPAIRNEESMIPSSLIFLNIKICVRRTGLPYDFVICCR